MKTHLLNLRGGQILEVLTKGMPANPALVFHHGGFGSSINMVALYRAAEEFNTFCIGITRPGYAESTPRRGRRAKDYVLETQAALNHFGIYDFVSFGWSSGALGAISDLQDNRCRGAVVISGDSPRTDEDWPQYIAKYPAVGYNQPASITHSEFENENYDSWRSITAEQLIKNMGEALSPADRLICQGTAGEELAAGIRYGMAAGDFGVIDDLIADNSEWGIDFGSLMQPVAVFHGDEDRLNTPAHAHQFVDKLPNATMFMYQGEGHISLINNKAKEIISEGLQILNSPR